MGRGWAPQIMYSWGKRYFSVVANLEVGFLWIYAACGLFFVTSYIGEGFEDKGVQMKLHRLSAPYPFLSLVAHPSRRIWFLDNTQCQPTFVNIPLLASPRRYPQYILEMKKYFEGRKHVFITIVVDVISLSDLHGIQQR